ncbi:TAP-like protein-domain-containing protein [Auriculariales sp. MPI-PUGE-AT-0066]|nr:TAP-like protein-domain-containing protein [Auriculariales sp. MPI-PUGE-AT-0066]
MAREDSAHDGERVLRVPSGAGPDVARNVPTASLNSSNGDLARFSASFKIFGHLAEARDTEIGRLVSTSFTARDMLLITEAFGWPQLQFIGYSYGSVLGLVFATMFPDRVGRIVVDGIVDLDDYFVGAWSNNLRDADKEIDLVSKACSLSPTHCMLYEPSGPLVRARIERILGNLYKDPLVVFDSDASLNTRYGIVDYGSAKLLLLKMLYSPYALFPITANAFAAAEKGDGRPLFNLLYPRGMAGSEWRCKADRDPSDDEVPVLLSMEALGGIACGDAPPKMSTLGDTWFPHTLCAGWKMQATESFRGPFGGNTSHPVLVVGNTADPVTPLWSAEKMARGFSSAVVLTQDSIGHASISAVSPCTFHHIIQYLHEGTLPPEGTVCNIVTSIFPPEDDVVAAVTATLSVAEQRLISPLQELVRKVKLPTLAHLPLFG